MPTEYSLPGVNVLLEGPSGTGKTYAIGTLVDAGIETFYLALESGFESLAGYWTDRGQPIPGNLHWHKLDAPTASFDALIDSAQKINTLPLDALSKLADPKRSQHNQFVKLLQALNNFVDDRTGEAFGPVDKWDQSRAIVIDGMSGISNAALSLVVGGKPVRSQADWGIAQNTVEQLILMLCNNCKCHFILLAHVEREVDQVLGGIKLMTSTLGKALAPKIPAMFSDVILTVRGGDRWSWDTASTLADVKTRNLPIAAAITPDFKQIIEKWRNRQKDHSNG